MDVIIEARALSQKRGGVTTYVRELVSNILSLYPEDTIELLYGNSIVQGEFPQAKETVIPLHSEVLLPYWLSYPVARHIRSRKPGVSHFTKAALPRTAIGPTVVTIYDIIPLLLPESQSPLRRLYWPTVLEYAATHASHIMTISEQSRKDISERYGITDDKITVTPLAVDLEHFTPLRPRLGRGSAGQAPYILFVGTKDRRKNIPSLIRAFAAIADKIPHQLLIVGKHAHKQDASMQTVASYKLQDRVEFRENVLYEELPTLYSQADIFVWPSVYEGWGFPPQEAMACGTPVIVSNGGPLPEVVGDAGIIVPFQKSRLADRMNDEGFIENLAHEMLALISDEQKKSDLIRRGLERVRQFSWEDVARKTHEAYARVSL